MTMGGGFHDVAIPFIDDALFSGWRLDAYAPSSAVRVVTC